MEPRGTYGCNAILPTCGQKADFMRVLGEFGICAPSAIPPPQNKIMVPRTPESNIVLHENATSYIKRYMAMQVK